MAWKRLTIDDIRLILAEDEVEKLNKLSLAEDKLEKVINETLDMTANVWRGVLRSKGYHIDIRDCYIPPEYVYFVLVHARHTIWTRFPNSNDIALDERRVSEWDDAMEMLKKADIAPSSPYDPSDPENPNVNPDDIVNASIVNYPKRFPAWFTNTIFVDDLVKMTHESDKNG